MEELSKVSVVRGHHVYKEVWTPVIGEVLPVFPEPDNPHDKRAVAIFKEGSIVGHVPRELSKIFWFFVKHELIRFQYFFRIIRLIRNMRLILYQTPCCKIYNILLS